MIVCLRVDERLIHGQVAMTWTKELKLNGLVVASDEAASNEIQKMTLKMAVPEGIKCIIKSVEDVTTILRKSSVMSFFMELSTVLWKIKRTTAWKHWFLAICERLSFLKYLIGWL